jgi:lysophospholipase L1-like esterase
MNSDSVKKGIFFLLIILLHYQQPAYSTILISPTNPKINYYGRIDFSKPESPQYNWSGVIIDANFTGPEIGMKIEHPGSFYDIEIDGKTDTVISVKTESEYLFKKGLTEGTHRLRIKLRSENHDIIGTFMGLLVAEGYGLVDLPPKSSRKIEFIGDSYTAGYGIESPGRVCTQEELKKYTNVFKTFATYVTDAFHAQNISLGWSGAGMVKNYDPPTTAKRSAEAFPFYYGRLFGAADTKTWDFSSWIPDLIVICLGTNDYAYNRSPSDNPAPDDSMYIGDYHKFITRILGNYPNASILCVSTGNTSFEKNVRQVVAEQKSIYNNSKVFFASYPTALNNEACDWHPSIDDNKKVAKVLIDTIMKNIGWDTTSTMVEISSANKPSSPHLIGFHVVQSNGVISINTGIESSERIVFFSVDGKKVLQLFTDIKGKCCISRSLLNGKSFVFGNSRLGWRKILAVQ